MSISAHHDALIERAEIYLDEQYGPEGTRPQPYHDITHSRNVSNNARQIANNMPEGRMTLQATLDLGLAGIAHDLIRDPNDTPNDELRSAELVTLWMEEDGNFSRESISVVYFAIMATKIVVEEGRLRQSPRIDQGSGEVVVTDAILADADLASLGKPWELFNQTATLLFRERYPNASEDSDEFIAFDHQQVRFLQDHEYYTDEAARLFPHQDENLERIIDRLEAAGEDVRLYR